MLGLRKQIDCHNKRIGAPICDNKNLRGPGKQVDANLAIQLPLRLRNIRVTWAGQKVNPSDTLSPNAKRSNGLYATQHVNPASAPAKCMAATVAAGTRPRIGGVQATTLGTPADLSRHDGHVKLTR